MSINWGLGLAPDTGMNTMEAFRRGQQEREDAEARKALVAYARDPNEANLQGLAAFDPQFVMQQKQQQAKAHAEAEERRLIGAALNGDKAAREQLAYVNSDMYLKLDEHGKKQVDGVMNIIGQQAFSILQLPPEQQGPALQQALAGLKQQGIDTDAFRLSGNPTVDLKAALAMAGMLDDFEQFAQPKYTPIGENGLAGFQFGKPLQQGGQVQNFAPEPGPQTQPEGRAVLTAEQYRGAVNGLGAQAAAEWAKRNGMVVQIASEADYNALPPGVAYIDPNGVQRVKGQ